MSENSSSTSGGIGFCGLLAIVFIVLKLTVVIEWSWWWVLSPLWIPVYIFLVIAILSFIVYRLDNYSIRVKSLFASVA